MNSAFIARSLVKGLFQNKALLMVPECYWTGQECDLLVVMPCLRVVDIEIKTSRADFRRDASKDKWFHYWDWAIDGPYPRDGSERVRRRREWPQRVWKHYFAMPESIWTPDMADDLPSQVCGVLLLRETNGVTYWRCERRAKPDREAKKITPEAVLDIARLAGLRMWDALVQVESSRRLAA